MSIPRFRTADGRHIQRSRGSEDADDLEPDVSRFGAPLVFDAQGNLVSGTPSAQAEPLDESGE
jgi:hypothetical protein